MAVVLIGSALPTPAPTAAQEGEWSPPRTVYIPETGHTLDQLFLDLWRENGGASSYGYPITPEFQGDNGETVQYLQYARFEYWPEGDENGNTVRIAPIGEELHPRAVHRATSNGDAATSAHEAATKLAAWAPVDPDDLDETAVANGEAVFVEESEHTVQDWFKVRWEQTGGAQFLGNPLSEQYTLGDTTYQTFERGQLAQQDGGEPWFVAVGERLTKKYQLSTDPIAQGDIPTYSEELFVPPPPPEPEPATPVETADDRYNPNEEFWMEIDLTAQHATVYSGSTVVIETLVSTGRAGWDTPEGTFYVNRKIRLHDMSGNAQGESWHVPDVPWSLYFTNNGHAIHGAYWHDNFGTELSHGCINLPLDIAEWIYDRAEVGMRIEISY